MGIFTATGANFDFEQKIRQIIWSMIA